MNGREPVHFLLLFQSGTLSDSLLLFSLCLLRRQRSKLDFDSIVETNSCISPIGPPIGSIRACFKFIPKFNCIIHFYYKFRIFGYCMLKFKDSRHSL